MKTTKGLAIGLIAISPFCAQAQEMPIAAVFQRLQSQSPTEVSQAAAQLERQGRSDLKVREYIALHLPPLIEKGPAQLDYPGPWVVLVRLAGDLKIAEAAPALAKWLTVDNLGEITAASFIKLETNPAGKALAEIGDPAIPAVTGVFNHGTLRERRYAVYVLNLIDSLGAKKALREQLNNEPDGQLRDFIRKSLSG